ncbi:MAG: type IV pilus assembly protein PilM [Patescibacteria group bacterium]|nr:type IV pilus assembly protein PilM [Patescibacteria group bacterium]
MSIFGGTGEHFGLDIGANHIRLVELSHAGSKYALKAYAQAPVPAGVAQSDSKLDLQKLAKIISELAHHAGINTKNVVSAIPGTSVFNATVKLPPMSQSELEKAITYQAEQNIPLKIDEVKFDYQILSEDPTTKELTVMIIAATKTKVNQLLELLTYAELNVVALETSTVAMARSLAMPSVPLAMILDIGSTTTEIAVIEGGNLIQTRSFPLAGYGMTRAIAQNLGLETDQAEQFKQRFGLSQDKLEGQVYKVLEPILKNILDEAIRSAKFYQEQSGKKIERVILTGGSSRLPQITEYIKTYMGVEISYGNPWSNVSYKTADSDKLNQMAPEFATAVGLAMRG